MTLNILPSQAKGTVTAPPSKSAAHRNLILSGLCRSVCEVQNVIPSEDILATLHCLEALGASVRKTGTGYEIGEADLRPSEVPLLLPCGASGTTLRFFLPLALVTGRPAFLTGTEGLLARPLGVYEDLCRSQDIVFERRSGGIFVHGRLTPGEFEIPGDISSQFISGLLLALPFLDRGSQLIALPPVESRAYIDMTLAALRDYSVRAISTGVDRWHLPGKQRTRPHHTRVEGDWSNAAYLEALNLFGGKVRINGLNDLSAQGDKIYKQHFLSILNGKPTIDLSECPDLAPILIGLAAAGNGAVFTGTHRLQYKESDRGRVMAEELSKLGAQVIVEPERIWVGETKLHAPTEPMDSHNDHRVAMALAVLLTKYGGSLRGAEAVNKSWPDFFRVLHRLGVDFTEDAEPETPELPAGTTEEENDGSGI